MSKMIQVRDVPDALHRELMRRARSRGETLTQYIEGVLRREVARPPAEEVFERVRARRSVDVPGPVAELIREERTLREIS
jgi:hypothetical protein